MPECNACGGFVTPDFARVFGDNANDVYGCHECLATADIIGGTLSKPRRSTRRG